MSITLLQISEKAGVSVAAVSKALNGRKDISPSTRRRIKRLANEMGYMTNVAARTLIMKKTMAIGVVLSLPHIPTVTERLRGIQAAAMAHNYLTTVAFHSGKTLEELQQVERLYGRVDGLVITPSNQSNDLVNVLRRISLPVVCMSEPLLGMETDLVGDDDAEGGRLAAAHLFEMGCHRIAYLGCDPQIPSDQSILQSVRAELAGSGSSLDDSYVRWGNTTSETTRQNVKGLLMLNPRPQGIMAFSDMTAMWVLQTLEECNIGVPGEMAVIGYDNTEFAALARIPLTSVAQPNFHIGQQAANVLLERLKVQNGDTPYRRVRFRPNLVIRTSSRFGSAGM